MDTSIYAIHPYITAHVIQAFKDMQQLSKSIAFCIGNMKKTLSKM